MDSDIPNNAREQWQVPSFDLPLWLGRRGDYCVVIPVINEGERIQHFLVRLVSLQISRIADVIIVDSGSNDGSLDLDFLQNCGVRGLVVKTGPGKLSAQLRCAYSFALDRGYEGIVTIDGNDKDDPEAIPHFIEALMQGADFVQASRFIAGGEAENTPASRYYAIRWIHAPILSAASGFHWTDTTQGFRGYSRKMLIDPRVAPFRNVMSTYELLAYLSYRCPQLGFRCMEQPTARRYPASVKVPTKIGGLMGNLALFLILLKACIGSYNPR